MSVFDILKANKLKSTRQFVGIKSIEPYGIETFRNTSMLYFIVKPKNLAVLSESNITQEIQQLMVILKEVDEVALRATDSRESFESNKEFYLERLKSEPNEKVRNLLMKDSQFLERIQIQTASAREFLVTVSLLKAEETEIYQTASRISKLLNEQGYHAKIADQEDIKRLISVYLVQNMTNVYYDNFDGESYAEKVENNI